jgi:hypothetical protein
MHPTFTTPEQYKSWRQTWRALYAHQTKKIRADRAKLKRMARTNPGADATRKLQRELHFQSIMAFKTMTLLDSAKQRWARILAMDQQMADQMASFPLTVENCPMVDFHFNKGSIEFPSLPAWVLKTKGKSYYVHHVDFSATTGTTRETPDHPSTKGAIRFRHCTLTLNADGSARITPKEVKDVALAA